MNFNLTRSRRIYLDYASSTPLDVKMCKQFPKITHQVLGANPSALHAEGLQARAVLETARALVARTLGAHADEILFTSGATESDNLALAGAIESFRAQGIALEDIVIVTSVLEHAAVTETLALYKECRSIVLPAEEGVIDPRHIIVPETAKAVLISIMYVNNEIGSVEPIKEIAKRVRKLRKEFPDIPILFHTDATQAPLYFNLRVDQLGVDMMTLGATKLYTHKGVGVLYKKRNVKLQPLMRGGGQERGLRPGTESIGLIHAFAHALHYAQEKREQETNRVHSLQTYFEEKLLAAISEVSITATNHERSPHISHIAIKDFDSELLVIELDAKGIAVSAKSACKNDLPRLASGKAGEDQESSIVESMYGKGFGAVRFSFGRTTTKRELNRAVRGLIEVINKYKSS